MKKRIKSLWITVVFLSIILFLPNMVKAESTYYTESKEGTTSSNVGQNNYLIMGSPVNSYLYTNSDGTLTRVEYIENGNSIVVEKYNTAFQLLEKKTIAMELSLFGGFFSGEDYNYIVFGQNNKSENDNVEVIRVVKYSKSWEKISSLSMKACNTYSVFDYAFGSCRITESNGILYINTAHQMYKSDDGYNHQSNMLIKIKEEDMSLQYCRDDVSIYATTGYVSHSFNQYITTDGNYFYTVDQGDGAPRAVLVCKTKEGSTAPSAYAKVLEIQGTSGQNATGVSVGGVELSTNNVIVVGNSVEQNASTYNSSADRNVFLTITPKEGLSTNSTQIKWLTNYPSSSSVTVGTPQIVKISDNRFLVMWEEMEKNTNGGITNVKALLVDENGNSLTKTITFGGRLSDCQPIVYNGKVTWYVTVNQESPIFFTLDCSSNNIFESYDNLGMFTLLDHFTYNISDSTGLIEFQSFDEEITSVDMNFEVPPWYHLGIADGLFENCTRLKSVILLEDIEKIPERIFSGCTSLTSVTIPDSVKTIGGTAFDTCTSLASIQLPENLEGIEAGAFEGCSALTEITLPNTLTTLGSFAFSSSGLTKVTLPSSITDYGSNAFYNCGSLTEVVLPENMTEIPKAFFYNSDSLSKVNIPKNVTKIGALAFARTNITELTLPETLETIEYNAFYSCRNLTGTITIPENVTTIGNKAFDDKSQISKIIVQNENATIGENAFSVFASVRLGESSKPIEASQIASCTVENEAIATVASDGTVTGVKIGSTYVYYYNAAGTQIGKATITVTRALLKGDVNKDGRVNLYDALQILKQAILGGTLTDEQLYIMDYNDDGKVNLYDALKFLQQAILG